jgi:DNA repair photolyase
MKLESGYYQSPRWSWEILDCAMPMTFDTYSNCAHQCVYCFAYFQRAVGDSADDYLHHKVRSVNVDKVRRMFTDPEQHGGQFAWYIKQRRVLQWGGLSDGFDWYERKFRKSLELLKLFRELEYPISISTKGIWWLDDPEYREVIQGADHIHLKITIITDDDQQAKVLEAGTPSPAERFEALGKASELGVVTTLRFRPYILGVSDKCDEAMIRRAKEVGCYSVTTEFLCVEGRSAGVAEERFKRISEVTGYDVMRFYRANSDARSGLLRLNYDLKRPHIRRMQAVADEVGLPFFVSDAHHKEAGCGSGCCGLPETGPLGNSFKGQFAEAVQIAKDKGEVRWSDIEEEAKNLKEISFYRAENFNAGSTRNRAQRRYQSMYDYMREIWNDTKSKMSPAKHHGGVMVPTGVDEHGDVIYTYNEPWVKEGVRISSISELTGPPQDLVDQVAQVQKQVVQPGIYRILIASRGRAETITTHRLFRGQDVYIVVQNEADLAAYEANPDLAGCSIIQTEEDAGLGYTRQWAMDNIAEEGEWVIHCDDNIDSIQAVHEDYYQNERLPVDDGRSDFWREIYEQDCAPNRFLGQIVQETIDYAEFEGAHYAAFGNTGNFFFRGRKWSLVGHCWVTLSLVKVERDVRFDPAIRTMDDYQFTAEQLLRHGAVVINKYAHAKKRRYQSGGLGTLSKRLEQKLKDIAKMEHDYPGLFRRVDRANSEPGAEIRVRFTSREQVERWRAELRVEA